MPAVTGRHSQSPTVPYLPLPSPTVPRRPLQFPVVPTNSRRPLPSPTVDYSSHHKPAVFMRPLHISVSYCRLVVLTQDGRLYILRTRTAYFLPSRPVPGSWQSVLRALSGPWPVGNTARLILPRSCHCQKAFQVCFNCPTSAPHAAGASLKWSHPIP